MEDSSYVDLCALHWSFKIIIIYLVSLGLGWGIVAGVYRGLATYMGLTPSFWQNPQKFKAKGKFNGVPPTITGLIERFVFTSAVFLDPTSGVPASGAWLALKMASNWHRGVHFGATPDNARRNQLDRIRSGFLALLCGLISLFIAVLSGYAGRWLFGLEGAFGVQCKLGW